VRDSPREGNDVEDRRGRHQVNRNGGTCISQFCRTKRRMRETPLQGGEWNKEKRKRDRRWGIRNENNRDTDLKHLGRGGGREILLFDV